MYSENSFAIPISKRLIVVWPPADVGNKGSMITINEEVEIQPMLALNFMGRIQHKKVIRFKSEAYEFIAGDYII